MFRRVLLALGLLAAAPAIAAEPWREASSAHFVIYSQEDEPALRRYAEQLERFDAAMRWLRKLGDEPMGKANRLTVYVVRDTGQVRRLLGDGPNGVAGFYHGRAGGSVAFTPRLAAAGPFDLSARTVLLHEYAHHFMSRYFPAAYPAWFVEGFAEFNATARFERDGGVGVGLPAGHRAIDIILGTRSLGLADMLGETRERLSDNDRQNLYSRGWLLTHYLAFAPARQAQLTRYLAAINKGVAAATAATDAFGPLDQLDRELRAYVSKPLKYIAIPPDKLPVGTVSIRLLPPGAQAMLPVAMRSQRGVNETTAPPLAAEARGIAAAFPADAYVQGALAEAEYDAGDLAADATSMQGLLYKARVQLARTEKAEGAARAPLIRAARATITRANRLDPDDPRPLLMFYMSFRRFGDAPTRNAVTGLTVAHRLAPEDDGLRLTLAQQFVQDRRPDEVRILLAPIVNDPHGGGAREAARAMLASLDGTPAPPADPAPAKP